MKMTVKACKSWSILINNFQILIPQYRVFLKGWNSPTLSKSLIFWTFPNVLGFFYYSIWAIFILVLLRHIIEKKKCASSKNLKFQDWLNLANFWILIFFGFLSITSFQTMQIWNVGGLSSNSGNLQYDGHKNFLNWWRNAQDNWNQSWQPPNFNHQKMSQF